MLAAAALFGPGCRRRPSVDPGRVRPAVETVVSRLRASDSALAAELETLRREAEVVAAAEAAAPWWSRQPERSDAAWERLAVVTARMSLEHRRRQDELAALWEASGAAAGEAVDRALRLARQPGMGAEEASASAGARAMLEAGRARAAVGDLEGAIAAADRAMERVVLVDRRWRAEQQRFSDPEQLAWWRRLASETVAESQGGRSPAIVVDKLHRRLLVYDSGRLELVVAAEIGSNGLRQKRHAGDRATPEGRYRVTVKKAGPATRYHKALLIDYPNPEDRRRFRGALAAGEVPAGVGPGSLIEIHGGGGSGRDWTDGCVALSDADMDLIFDRVGVGTPVTIVGTLATSPQGVGQ